MTTAMLYAAILVWGALYVGIVAAAGIASGNKGAVIAAAVTAGVTYLCFLAQTFEAPELVRHLLVGGSILLGCIAGATLL